ncbi:MAG: 2,3-diphosphoglycerate-dependent phosphoglycerate mutase [Dehalococcoidia bacterium]
MAKLVLIRHGESQWNLENRFTGWIDVPLTANGEAEARKAGEQLREAGIHFDQAFTSVLQRANRTLDIVLDALGQVGIPTAYDLALNERHYGDLQGLNKAETAARFGDEQVHIWRRSFDVPPPNGESLKDTAARTLPYFDSQIMPAVKSGKNVLVAAHGNSLRSIVMEIEELSPAEILQVNIGTGVPLTYDVDADGTVHGRHFKGTLAAG